ncbi:MAG: EamA family transporter [Gemmatimonadales bacterium]|jgi:drug/metabolite transporter (DMT)-like permease
MRPLTGKVLGAYIVVCLVWGSTYLAIRVGVRHMPPALFGGIRFLVAGTTLLGLAAALRYRLPSRLRDWWTAAIVGILLLGIGNGLVIWAEQYVESGFVAILIVTGALWMAGFDAIIPGSDTRPTWRQFVGLLVGLAGTAILVGGNVEGFGAAGLLGPVGVVVAAASWALGSIYSKRHPVETGPHVHAALQMVFGGGFLVLVGLLRREAGALEFTPEGLAAVAYLIVFGSIVAYTSYVYLLRHAAPAFIGTHVYVNTVVAVLLGWVLLGEHVTPWTFVAMAVIIGSVMWVRREVVTSRRDHALIDPDRAYPRSASTAGRSRDR